MSQDPLLPIAPARVKALLLPVGKIKAERFTSFVERLQGEHVVHLRDITADGRPNRNMFSPLAFPGGAILYDLITHSPPSSHLALSPFDLYREPLAIIAISDGQELHDEGFTKRMSSNGSGPTVIERNMRALDQELEDMRDNFSKALVHKALLFDYSQGPGSTPVPEGITAIPTVANSKRTTMKTVMCDISSLLLAEMTALAKSFEAMPSIESPGSASALRHMNWSGGESGIGGSARRNSQFSMPQQPMRSSSVSATIDKSQARMSMPPVPTRSTSNAGSTNSSARPQTPITSTSSPAPGAASEAYHHGSTGSGPSSPEQKLPRSDSAYTSRDPSRDRVSVQGFGPGGANDKWRLRGKGRVSVVIGSMYLQAGRWLDSIKELSEGATAARSLNDHIWHGKALELILMNMLLLAWTKADFQIPAICLPTQERPSTASASSKPEPEAAGSKQPKSVTSLQGLLPELLERVINLYSRISSESLPPLAFSETTIRFCKILSAVHCYDGVLDDMCLNAIIMGKPATSQLTTSPRLSIVPTRQQITNLLFKAFPSNVTELLTTADRIAILSGIASVLGPLGYQRKKALVVRELISVMINGLVEARTKGAAEAGVHPAAGLVSLNTNGDQGGSLALDLGEGDVEQGIEAFLELLCRSYGVVSFEPLKKPSGDDDNYDGLTRIDDSDSAILNRIRQQAAFRCFGFPSIKLDVLRACINFSEALPDFNGVLKFSSDLLRTAGSGVAPGSRREDSAPLIQGEEQARLSTSILRTWSLAQRVGLGHLNGEFWDEFLLRGIELEPLPATRIPIAHAKSILPGAITTRASQDVNPFIYNPFLKEPAEVSAENLVAGEVANFKVTLQNTYEVELDIESICIEATGVKFEGIPASTVIGPYRTQVLILKGKPLEAGTVTVTGAHIKIRGCRARRFPIFSEAWNPVRPDKVKGKGLSSIEDALNMTVPIPAGKTLEAQSVSLNVVQEQPLVAVKSTSLRQSSIMILEGERQIFSITLQNLSKTPVDFMLFSFKDSTQASLQAALSSRDATPAELYEYELVLMKKQALRLPTSDQNRNIPPGGEATFEFEILGKAGLTNATIQLDYTYLGIPRDEITDEFYTRQVSLDLAVTVNASIDLSRIDTIPIHGAMPLSIWERVGGQSKQPPIPNDYCLVSMDLRNSWPNQISVHLESQEGIFVDENILPGKTCRVVIPIKRIYLADPHASIPSLNPSRNRQFVVSTSKISPSMERANREAFWYREKILDSLRASWKTTSVPKRSGMLDLRGMRLSPRMIDAIKIDDVDISISLGSQDGSDVTPANVAYVDEFMTVKVRIANRTSFPILPIVRLMPALCHRPLSVALEYTRKFAWNGTLQQIMPTIQANDFQDFVIGVTTLCRGEFELTASVEEVQILESDSGDASADGRREKQNRKRSESQQFSGEISLGIKERRTWHSKEPFYLVVRDRE